MQRRALATVAVLSLLVACSSGGGKTAVDAAQARVNAAAQDVKEAQSSLDSKNAAFCTESKDYVTSLDRYGKLFEGTAATVGDLKTLGADLEKPRATTQTAAQAVRDGRTALATANKELVDAQTALAAAQSSAAESAVSASSAPPSTSNPFTATTATTTPPIPAQSIDRVTSAEADLEAASNGITDQTPLAQAAATYNAAAFELEIAWLSVLADAGCLTDQQEAKAVSAVRSYTESLQTALQAAGYYSGVIDGVYGPATVMAVQALQTAAGLPPTGYVDQATAVALDAALVAKGGAAAAHATTQTAALQTTLKLAGYWPGPIDGKWTTELTDALKAFQTALQVEPTGVVDAATLAALTEAIRPGSTSPSTTTTSTPTTTGSTIASTSSSSS